MKFSKKTLAFFALFMAVFFILPSTITRASNGLTDVTAAVTPEVDTSEEDSVDTASYKILSTVKLEDSSLANVIELVSQQPYHVLHLKNSTMQTYNVDSDSIDVAMYQDWRFSWRSAPEKIALQMDCDTISLHATCDGDVIDELVFHVIDITHNGLYDMDLPFPADGSVTTIACGFPAGKYQVFATGDTNITKPYLLAVFTKLNTGLLSTEQNWEVLPDLDSAVE